MLGILGGAMAGLGGAMQQNAQSTLEEQRQMRLEEMRNRYQTQRDEAQHGRTLERDEIQHGRTLERDELQHGRTLERDELSHGRSFELERYRQGQANARSAASRSAGSNDWTMVTGEDGQMYQFSPSRNEYRAANLPEGVRMAGGDGRLTDQQKQRYKFLESQVKQIDSRLQEDLSLDEATRAALVRQQSGLLSEMDELTGGRQGGGGSLEDRLVGRLGAGGGEEGAPAPEGIIERARHDNEQRDQNRAQAEERRAADSRLRAIEQAIGNAASGNTATIEGGIAAGVPGRGGRGMSPEEAQRLLDEIAELEAAGLTPRQESRAAKLVRDLLPAAGN